MISVESIQRDFGPSDKPLWPLSSYGAAKYEPTFLEGLDVSPEELRFRAWEATKDGKMQEYVSLTLSHLSFAQPTSMFYVGTIRNQCHSEC
jgi:nucleoporin NUP42